MTTVPLRDVPADAEPLAGEAPINSDLIADEKERMVQTHRPRQMIQDSWDQQYADADQLWSGQPNAALVSETRGLHPRRALDVGCGEGADALWLTEQGWDVTALDVSKVALDRAARQADRVGAQVHWLHSGLVEAMLPPASFDLVSAQYAALRRTESDDATLALLAAVAPGGVLLVVHHLPPRKGQATAHSFNPDQYVTPVHVAAMLDGAWRIEVDETRPRNVTARGETAHTHDVVLLARRLPSNPNLIAERAIDEASPDPRVEVEHARQTQREPLSLAHLDTAIAKAQAASSSNAGDLS